MIVTYNIGSLAARLKLAGINYLNGGVIQHDLSWRVQRLGEDALPHTDAVYESDRAQVVFDIASGNYRIVAIYQGEEIDCGEVVLKKNTLTDCVFIFNQAGEMGADGDYFADPDVDVEYERRKVERSEQSSFGPADLPVRDPNPISPEGQGEGFQSHPLLKNSAQFDGVEANMTVQPSENRQAVEMTLQNQLQNQARPDMLPNPRAGG